MVWNGVAKFYVETFESTLAFLYQINLHRIELLLNLKLIAIEYCHQFEYFQRTKKQKKSINMQMIKSIYLKRQKLL